MSAAVVETKTTIAARIAIKIRVRVLFGIAPPSGHFSDCWIHHKALAPQQRLLIWRRA
jgi:hypothetical protein